MLRRTFIEMIGGTATGMKVLEPNTATPESQCRNTLWQIDGNRLVVTADIPDKAEYVEFQLVGGAVHITRPDGTTELTYETLTIRDSKVFCQVDIGDETESDIVGVTVHIN